MTPAEVGWDPAALEEALSFAGERKSSGVVVLYNGRILAEQYWKLPLVSGLLQRPTPYVLTLHGKSSSGHQIEDVASVQKSVVAVLVGIAQQKGLLKITDRVDQHLGAGWSKAPREAESQITLRHLLTMTSGLNTRLELAAEAGTKWRYNTTAYAQSLKALAAAADMQPNELTRNWLTGPIGMADSRWVRRPLVKTLRIDANPYGFATTARDLARFGLLILAEGVWGEKAVVEDRKYLRVDVTKREFVDRRIRDIDAGRVKRLVALVGDKIVADGALELAGHDWTAHVGELRLIVAREYQRRGLGMLMARELYSLAAANKVEQIMVTMMRPQVAARSIFRRLGFREELVLPEHVKDRTGAGQDLILMRCDLEALWRELEGFFEDSDWRRMR